MIDKYPEIAAEWVQEKNGEYTPYNTLSFSHRSVVWKCKKGHEYRLSICKRTKRGYGCPYCSGKKPIIGENDFKFLYPEIAKQWDYEKNTKKPEEFLPFSHYKAFWKCEKDHSFQCNISDRTAKKVVCPYCYGRYVIKGENDLASINLQLAMEWNYEKNGNILPSEVTAYSNKKVWWICAKCGFEWRAMINNRAYGKGCPKHLFHNNDD